MSKERRVLIIVQNLPVPLDRRVWLECQALVAAGYGVSVICPRGDRPEDCSSFEVLDGVNIHRYGGTPKAEGVVGFFYEFAYCWLVSLFLAIRVYRREGFQVIQGCNPPDTFWALALLFRPLGVKYVFDQHDMCPEVYQARFERPSRLLFAALKRLERWSYRSADQVIVTNAIEREIALQRGGRDGADVTVVRNAPLSDRFVRGASHPELKRGRTYLCCYLGVMGPQDGVDIAIRAADVIVHKLGRSDVSFALMGFGDSFDDLRALVEELDVGDYVELTGRADDTMIGQYLSTADVGLVPDPPTAFNDISSMNKTVEYMAFTLPLVAFDLRETRATAGAAGVYVGGNDPAAFADAVVALLDDPDRRAEMGGRGREKLVRELAWEHQADAYVHVYDRVYDRAR
ncbi:MAG: glycosyl transferase group 1 [Actinomycetia bacterium]|nr:glycosyl transferase group 1 [Actinomycetes bacterium]